MNVVVFLPNVVRPCIFKDASFTVGLNVHNERITPSAMERIVRVDGQERIVREYTTRAKEYVDNQMLCINRGKPGPDGSVLTTVVFAPGHWASVWDGDDPACAYPGGVEIESSPTAQKRKK